MDSTKPVPPPQPAAVALAYEIAVSAYTSAREQGESVHRRIDTLLSFITTVTIAAPVAVEAVLESPSFSSPLLIGGIVLYMVTVVMALVAVHSGRFGEYRLENSVSSGFISMSWTSN